MAFMMDPRYGRVPGAPYGTNWWSGPGGTQFNISDLLRTMPPPPPPLAPSVTPQDTAAQSGAIELRTDTGGGEGGYASGLDRGPDRGGTAMSTGGPPAADTEKGLWGTVGAPPGSPAAYNSNYGGILGGLGTVAGTALGVPGVGMLGGVVGSNIDMANYAANLRAAGIAIAPDYLAASIAGALPSLPGTNIGQWLSEQLGIPSARSQSEAARRDALAMGMMTGNTTLGPTAIDDVDKTILDNPEIFGLSNVGYQGPAVPAFDPASLGREAGYGGQFGVEGAPQGQTGYQSGTYVSGIEGGSPDSPAGYGGAPSFSGGASYAGGAAGNAPGGGDTGRDTGFYRGGLVGAPPGRYAAGGAVRAAGRMPTRSEAEFIPIVPRDFMSDFQPGWDEYFPGGGRRDAQPDASGQLPAREQMIEDAMRGYGIGRNREGYPEAFAAGGQVPPTPGDNITPQQFGALRGINPPGPDDQIGALQTGEGVIRKDAMQRYPGLLAAANAGTLDPGRVKGLLTPAGMGRKPRLVR